jgi:hypothetical protein
LFSFAFKSKLLTLLKTKNPSKLHLKGFLFVGVAGFEPATSCSQSRRDNRATLHPEGDFLFAERQGFEPWQRLPVDRLAICSITTLAPLPNFILKNYFFGLQMYYMLYNLARYFNFIL